MLIEALYSGFLYSILISVLVLLSFKHEPRIWLHHFPKQFQDAVPSRTKKENRLMKLWSIPITGSMLLVPLAIALWRHSVLDFSYVDAVMYIGIIMLVFCVVDLVILDWLISICWNPKWMQIEGTESVWHYNSFKYQLYWNLKGLPFPIIGALITALPFLWI